jgi:hypothetical protein
MFRCIWFESVRLGCVRVGEEGCVVFYFAELGVGFPAACHMAPLRHCLCDSKLSVGV